MTMSQYLGRGAKSRGRMTITKALTTVVSTLPYLQDKNDVQAVIQGIKNLQAALANVEGLTWTYPPSNITVEDFVNDVRYALDYLPHMNKPKLTVSDARIVYQSTLKPLDW